ncbi:hypothetical protein D3C76_1215310 [compost metagenome]
MRNLSEPLKRRNRVFAPSKIPPPLGIAFSLFSVAEVNPIVMPFPMLQAESVIFIEQEIRRGTAVYPDCQLKFRVIGNILQWLRQRKKCIVLDKNGQALELR